MTEQAIHDESVQFFYDHADWSYEQGETSEQGRMRCAQHLAAAEEWAQEHDVVYEWEEDWESDRDWMDEENGYDLGDGTRGDDNRPLWCCLVKLPCKCASCCCSGWAASLSLCGIDLDRTGCECDPYKRVVEAELASELMD